MRYSVNANLDMNINDVDTLNIYYENSYIIHNKNNMFNNCCNDIECNNHNILYKKRLRFKGKKYTLYANSNTIDALNSVNDNYIWFIIPYPRKPI